MTDNEIIQAILAGGKKEITALKFIYHATNYHSAAKGALKKYNLRLEGWEDVFHDALIILVRNIKLGKFDPQKSLVNYLFGICRHLCQRKQGKEKKEVEFPEFELDQDEDEGVRLLDLVYYKELKSLLRVIILKLNEKCQAILKLWSLGFSAREIAEKLNISNEEVVRVNIHRCRKKLKEQLRSQPNLMKTLKDLRWI